MTEIRVTTGQRGEAHIDLAPGTGGEVRDAVALDALEDAARIPALDALVLEFDFYGRLAGIRVTDSAPSVLAPGLLDSTE